MTPNPTSKPNLTTNDSAVLQALFDAESSPSNSITIDSSLPTYPSHLNITPELLQTLQSREVSIIRTLQSETTLDIPTIQQAIKDLDTLIAEHPTYPSAYVNRAQTLRILIDKTKTTTESSGDDNDDDKIFDPENTQPASTLLADLGNAITLATPRSPADPVSSVQARLLADAHTHRGYLLLKAARVKKERKQEEVIGGPDQLRVVEPEQLEDMASRDFFFGGRYGNKVAQQLAVQTNPYAKMCGAIVKEALRKEVVGDGVVKI
ncbi:hypothetical protein CBS63078_10899 [Aspergillus niger]|uniref:Contig An11c0070, genomic contig n=4 Tax=Aspergillus niger TaxID=5061 RepID=A2QVP7_ASPNC|nr:uncharacterized protein An11g02190 [Aspergillus niger]EHA19432.1 hypothetical protein ASPNIDRAFT_38852 [Aspergillus niger ATCC 1015]RDH15719.1 hypothetical protein M747DRAFT_130100 [Aspergillus niger ATCC 13496]KAI2814010.1 hypothetical protein CBS115989_8891 [Aspergillus niger]KAI2824741.1 hypothetical protein CBS133816_8791 [Aspergillus niger]KAI2835672.1 hypothetical protein CBS11350_9873 [Aspergillus niger]|eukprot:XP_001394221.1 hypothetical protein ANI_1_1714094 [Aspergillus niger CBS 513.88]